MNKLINLKIGLVKGHNLTISCENHFPGHDYYINLTDIETLGVKIS